MEKDEFLGELNFRKAKLVSNTELANTWHKIEELKEVIQSGDISVLDEYKSLIDKLYSSPEWKSYDDMYHEAIDNGYIVAGTDHNLQWKK